MENQNNDVKIIKLTKKNKENKITNGEILEPKKIIKLKTNKKSKGTIIKRVDQSFLISYNKLKAAYKIFMEQNYKDFNNNILEPELKKIKTNILNTVIPSDNSIESINN